MDKYIDADKLLKRINEQKLMAREPAAKRIIGYINEAAAEDASPVIHGKWEYSECRKVIDLENANRQYRELGYPHRTVINMHCPVCRMITMVDETIGYEYCPHCGAKMDLEADGHE